MIAGSTIKNYILQKSYHKCSKRQLWLGDNAQNNCKVMISSSLINPDDEINDHICIQDGDNRPNQHLKPILQTFEHKIWKKVYLMQIRQYADGHNLLHFMNNLTKRANLNDSHTKCTQILIKIIQIVKELHSENIIIDKISTTRIIIYKDNITFLQSWAQQTIDSKYYYKKCHEKQRQGGDGGYSRRDNIKQLIGIVMQIYEKYDKVMRDWAYKVEAMKALQMKESVSLQDLISILKINMQQAGEQEVYTPILIHIPLKKQSKRSSNILSFQQNQLHNHHQIHLNEYIIHLQLYHQKGKQYLKIAINNQSPINLSHSSQLKLYQIIYTYEQLPNTCKNYLSSLSKLYNYIYSIAAQMLSVQDDQLVVQFLEDQEEDEDGQGEEKQYEDGQEEEKQQEDGQEEEKQYEDGQGEEKQCDDDQGDEDDGQQKQFNGDDYKEQKKDSYEQDQKDNNNKITQTISQNKKQIKQSPKLNTNQSQQPIQKILLLLQKQKQIQYQFNYNYNNKKYHNKLFLLKPRQFNKQSFKINTSTLILLPKKRLEDNCLRLEQFQNKVLILNYLKQYLDDYSELGEQYQWLGINYLLMANYDKSYLYLIKANDVFRLRKSDNEEQILTKKMHLAIIYHNLGVLYEKKCNPDEALSCCRQSIRISIELDYKKQIIESLNLMISLMTVYFSNYEQSEQYFGLALQNFALSTQCIQLAHLYHNYALYLLDIRQIEHSITWFIKALNIFLSLKIKEEIVYCYFNLINCHLVNLDVDVCLQLWKKSSTFWDQSLYQEAILSLVNIFKRMAVKYGIQTAIQKIQFQKEVHLLKEAHTFPKFLKKFI